MDSSLLTKLIFEAGGGLGIFLLGMRYMSDGMQAVAGERLRILINAVTNNRILACMVGITVTCLIQSSSITTVMVVGMVNAGVMTLVQSVGVILGANIGTTITGWILALKIGKYGLPIIGFAALFFLFSKREKVKFTFMLILGLGMIFFGLELMSNGFRPLRYMDGFQAWFARFSPHDYFGVLKCCLVGAVLTAIVQSSSATLGITISLATVGAIDFPTAAALVLGENIGTTITAFLASIGSSVNGKRASYAHIFVNLFGVLWITAIFAWYIKGVVSFTGAEPALEMLNAEGEKTFPNMAKNIAAVHTGFNVLNVVVLLPFIAYIAKLLEKLVPEKEIVVEEERYTHLDPRVYETPSIGIQQSMKEIISMYFQLLPMLDKLKSLMEDQQFEESKCDEVMNYERRFDVVQKEITEYVSGLMEVTTIPDVVTEGYRQLRIADEIESASDYVAGILKLNLKIRDINDSICNESLEDILLLHNEVVEMIKNVGDHLRKMKIGVIIKEATLIDGENITRLMKQARARHLDTVSNGSTTPLKSLSYTDILTSYRKIKDHLVNITEVIAS